MQDVVDQEYLQDLQRPSSRSHGSPQSDQAPVKGFVVRDAPWDRAPDTNSTEDFPSFGTVVAPRSGHTWGPVRKN